MKAAVAYISFFENCIKTEIVDVVEKDWRLALHTHSEFNKYPLDDMDWLPSDYEDARCEAVNGEMDFEVIWLEEAHSGIGN